jgi:hypothetical protein
MGDAPLRMRDIRHAVDDESPTGVAITILVSFIVAGCPSRDSIAMHHNKDFARDMNLAYSIIDEVMREEGYG